MSSPGLNPQPDPPPANTADTANLNFDQPVQPEQSTAKFCPRCGNAVVDSYYATATQEVLCVACGEAALAAIPPGPGAKGLLRAFVFGSGAAFAGLILYFAVLALTGYEIGFLAIAVGWMVGRAVRAGGFARGGRKLQLMAVGLTYLSIVGSYMTLGIKEMISQQQGKAKASATDTGQVRAGASGQTAEPAAAEQPQGPVTFGQFLLGIATLFAIALALPFLAGFENIIGLFIIALGLFEAWRINRKPPPEVAGPFSLNASA